MDTRTNQRWLPVAIGIAIVYPVVGIAFGALSNPSSSDAVRVAWRIAAWFVAGVVFAMHVGYEHLYRRSAPLRAAFHASVAVALGAFALAVWVLVHGRRGASAAQSALAPLALIIFPAVTGVPAFLVAFLPLAAWERVRGRLR